MAYGAKGERNGMHVEGKHQHAHWLYDDEWNRFLDESRRFGTDATGLMRKIANGDVYLVGRYHFSLDGWKIVDASGKNVTKKAFSVGNDLT